MGEARISCFKAYDVRGVVPDELNDELAYRIGRAYAAVVGSDGRGGSDGRIGMDGRAGRGLRVAVGRDVRPSGKALVEALTRGLNDAGVDVIDIGLCGTEQVYFATFHLGLDGGIMVTASHNPPEYNGMKFVRERAIPLSSDSGLLDIERRARREDYPPAVPDAARGRRVQQDVMDDYVHHLLGYVDVDGLKPFKIAANPGNGCAGPVLERLEKRLPFTFVQTFAEPDGSFPNGVPNPMLLANREATAALVRESGADFGIAWDGDFDRCFFFDETGAFIEGYYIVGLLAEAVLRRHPGAGIVHDPRLVWNTLDIVEKLGGRPVLCKSGHAFIKEKMRAEDAAYGGEMSAHHYFRDFSYADSGMIPWLLMAQLLSEADKPLSTLVAEATAKYPVSGEINRRVENADAAIGRIEERYASGALDVDRTDGLSVTFAEWRFNVRMSNTEPLLRLNVESRGDRELLERKTAELLTLIGGSSS